jgi:thioredoxin reductase (NADPH)
MGVSYCATCDGAFFRGRTVAVVGGGDVALEDAIYLARTCEKVYLIHRRDSLRGAMVLQEELKSLPNVEILYDHVVTEICGEDMVEKLRIKNVKTEAEKDLEAAGIFIAVGIHPNTELLRELVGKTVISLRMRPERPAAPAFMWPEISVRNLCARS